MLSTLVHVLVVALGLITLSTTQITSSCANGVHIIAARGHGSKVGSYGELQSTVNLIKAAIPGSNSLSLPYDNNGPVLFSGTIAGSTLLTNDIEEYVKSCPRTAIVLLAYSQGAILTMNTLCGTSSVGFPSTKPLPSTYAHNIIATIVFGDDTRAANQTYDQGTCTSFGPLVRTEPAGCAAFSPNIISYCDSSDPDCCIGGLDVTGNTHHTYMSRYNKPAVAFVKSQYSKFMD